MNVIETALPGVLIVEPRAFSDDRGVFFESWNRDRYARAGIRYDFVQDNVSVSRAGVLRGLHLQHPNGQAKLVSVLQGEVFDVCVDVRRGSPTFGKWVGVTLSDANHRQFMIPDGFAHGFVVTGDRAVFSYKTSANYDPASELTIAWNDPQIGIEWPVTRPVVSAKDAAGSSLARVPQERLPAWDAA